MPDNAYRVARRVARELASELLLTPPFDLDAVAERYADLLTSEVPGRTDVITLHGTVPGDHPRIVVQASLDASPARRRFAIAHALGHVLLGWHPLGAPCDVSARPRELPVTAHDLIEGEASAFARELLLPRAWIEGFDALDRPAELMRHVSERGGVPIMSAARAVIGMLPPHHVFMVVDEWGGVIDAGRSPGTHVCPPETGAQVDGADYARFAVERHRADLDASSLIVWRFDPDELGSLPHDRTARDVASHIGSDLGMGSADVIELVARVDGVAGWANEQLGIASLDGMTRIIDERVRALPEFAKVVAHPDYRALVQSKAVELVARRLARS
jgi:hypothetical protein